MAFEGSKVGRWQGKVSLTVVVEARNMTDNLVDLLGEFPDDGDGGEGTTDDHKISGQGEVFGVDCEFLGCGRAALGTRHHKVTKTHCGVDLMKE